MSFAELVSVIAADVAQDTNAVAAAAAASAIDAVAAHCVVLVSKPADVSISAPTTTRPTMLESANVAVSVMLLESCSWGTEVSLAALVSVRWAT